MTKLTVAFRNFAKASKNLLHVYFGTKIRLAFFSENRNLSETAELG